MVAMMLSIDACMWMIIFDIYIKCQSRCGVYMYTKSKLWATLTFILN